MFTAFLILTVCFVAFTERGERQLQRSGVALRQWNDVAAAGALLGDGNDVRRLDRGGVPRDRAAQDVRRPRDRPGNARSIAVVRRARVALGARATSFLATRFGFPVLDDPRPGREPSSARGLAGSGSGVHLRALGKLFLYPLFFQSRHRGGPRRSRSTSSCRAVRLAPTTATRTLDTLHFLATPGAASFARGLNDTPKMVALLLVAPGIDIRWGFVAVAVRIALGDSLMPTRWPRRWGRRSPR